MNIMFESDRFFVRFRSKASQLKVTIWNNSGDKIFSDFLGPEPAAQFWASVRALTNPRVTAEIKDRLTT